MWTRACFTESACSALRWLGGLVLPGNAMQVVEVTKTQTFYSDENGGAKAVIGSPIGVALNAKTVQLYLWISNVDANARVKVMWNHSADGVNYYGESTAIVDTGAGSAATATMYVGDSGATLFGAFVRFSVTIEEFATPNSLVSANVSLHAVFKPF